MISFLPSDAMWRNRFYELHELWKLLDPKLRPPMNEKLIRSWLADKPGRGRNQIEIWFSGLSRRVLKRGNFRSVDE